jgi:Protein of unknown function (DUF1059)
MLTVSCREVGMDCNYVCKGETEEEVNIIDIKMGCILIRLAAKEQAELYICAIENILSNVFLSDLSRACKSSSILFVLLRLLF